MDKRIKVMMPFAVPLVWVRHHENIARLMKGNEPRIGQHTANESGNKATK